MNISSGIITRDKSHLATRDPSSWQLVVEGCREGRGVGAGRKEERITQCLHISLYPNHMSSTFLNIHLELHFIHQHSPPVGDRLRITDVNLFGCVVVSKVLVALEEVGPSICVTEHTGKVVGYTFPKL